MLVLKYLFNSFSLYIFAYILLYFCSALIPNSLQKYGLLNNAINLSYLVQAKAQAVAHSMNETNLGLSFIGNYHKLSHFESQIFQSSGLVHLLAISGGQILPVVSLLCFFISYILFFLLKNKIKPHELMCLSSKTKIYISFLVSLFISILFGGTGALLRVSWLNFFRKINFLNSIQSYIFKLIPEFSEPLVNKFFILIIVSFLFGNIFNNYSFILSAIGASCAEISSYVCIFVVNRNKKHNHILPVFNKIMAARFFIEVLVTISTCILVGVILSPLTYNSILNSCLANIFAIPLVTFLITPLALLVLITPTNNVISHLFLTGLDYSLGLFKHIAIVFSENDLEENVFIKNTRLFSSDGLLYLNSVMLILWVVIDLIRNHKFFIIRMKYKNLF